MALAWDPDSNCRFTLAKVECGLRDRFDDDDGDDDDDDKLRDFRCLLLLI